MTVLNLLFVLGYKLQGMRVAAYCDQYVGSGCKGWLMDNTIFALYVGLGGVGPGAVLCCFTSTIQDVGLAPAILVLVRSAHPEPSPVYQSSSVSQHTLLSSHPSCICQQNGYFLAGHAVPCWGDAADHMQPAMRAC